MPRTRSIACLAAALLIAGSATAQPTPATPGTAGAEAAVTALVHAQGVQDWPAVVSLLDPLVVSAVAGYTRDSAQRLHALLADSAAVVASSAFEDDFDSDPGFFAMARRLDAVMPPGETLGDADLIVRVIRASRARQPGFFAVLVNPPVFTVLGTVTEGDSLAYVVGRETQEGYTAGLNSVGIVPMQWSGTRWTLAGNPGGSDGVLRDIAHVFGNWSEVVGGVIQDEDALATGAMEDGDEE